MSEQYRILVCDDEPHITRAVNMKLTRAGYHVETASDGQSAWEAIERKKPDLLISDCQMPRLGGIQLCQRIRATPELSDLPIILLTAKSLEFDEEVVHELWVNEVVAKPFSPRELLKLVQLSLGDVQPANESQGDTPRD